MYYLLTERTMRGKNTKHAALFIYIGGFGIGERALILHGAPGRRSRSSLVCLCGTMRRRGAACAPARGGPDGWARSAVPRPQPQAGASRHVPRSARASATGRRLPADPVISFVGRWFHLERRVDRNRPRAHCGRCCIFAMMFAASCDTSTSDAGCGGGAAVAP